jgi:AcrR family transcriptional regulator
MTRADALRNRARVIAAAETVFAEQGTDASVDEVAARAGVGKATVYRSFPTKETLVSAVASRQLETWLVGLQAVEGDAFDVLEHVLCEAAAAKALSEMTVSAATDATLVALRERWIATLETIVARADGTIRADATAEEITTLFGGVCRVLAGRGESDPAVWRRHAKLVAAGFRP